MEMKVERIGELEGGDRGEELGGKDGRNISLCRDIR